LRYLTGEVFACSLSAMNNQPVPLFSAQFAGAFRHYISAGAQRVQQKPPGLFFVEEVSAG
jgi:hypothetical protein